ncbi:MAG: TlpA family protein disulfide reductase [Chlorobi bacterium]|nr:TlpA family protein disulfide reductase [Chlorobiota bacterium]
MLENHKFLVILKIFALVFIVGACKQPDNTDLIKVFPDKYVKSQGNSNLPIYHLQRNHITIRDYENNKIDTLSILFPDLSKAIDTAYTYIQFMDDTLRSLKNKILILPVNYSTDTISLYCDLNNNLDLTDDGEPFILTSELKEVSIPIESPYEKGAIHYSVFYFPSYTKQSSIDNIENIFKGYAREKQKVSARYWFGKSSMNIISKDVVIGNDSVKIALIDNNENSLFNEMYKDKIVITQYGSDKVPDMFYEGAVLLEKNVRITTGRNGFEVDSISANGKFIGLRKISIDSVPERLLIGDKIPDFKFLSLKGDSISIYDFIEPGKKTYLEFWFIGCTGCMYLIPYIEEMHHDHNDKIKVISFNYEQSLNEVKKFVKDRNLDSPYGVVSRGTWKSLYGEYAPWGILLNENGRIEEFGVWGDEILKRYNKKE